MNAHVDAVVIGAGIIGSSVAERILGRSPTWRVVLLEKEAAPGTGETRWATGGVRMQFGTEPNVRLSSISVQIFERFGEYYGVNPRFHRHGYLFVTADPARLEVMDRELQLQHRLGVESRRMAPAEIKEICPALFTDDLRGGNFCALDGSIEPAALLQAYIDTFRGRGGAMATEAEVVAIEPREGEWRVSTPRVSYDTPNVVIACGADSRRIAALAGLDIPVYPFARQVFVAEPSPEIDRAIPLTVDMDTGFYVHATGDELLLGGTDRDSRPLEASAAEVDWDLFEPVRQAASHRMPAAAKARVTRAYAAARAVTPDHHPILGPVASHPGIYLATGLSGHGIMHSPAVGILLAEWIVEGELATWDAGDLTLDRFGQQRAIPETAIF